MDEEVDSTVSAVKLKEYLSQICPAMLGLKHGAAFVEEQLATPDSDFAIKKFVARPDTMVLFVDHLRSGDDSASDRLNASLMLSGVALCSLALIKNREAGIVSSESFTSQFMVMTLGNVSNEDGHRSALSMLQRITRHSFDPIIRLAASHSGPSNTSEAMQEVEGLHNVQKKLRELDLALEQSQASTLVPRVTLAVPDTITAAAAKCSLQDLRKCTDKFVAQNADALFQQCDLTVLLGSEQDKEAFANDINKYAKQWPAEISKQMKLIDAPFPVTVDKEVEFWRDYDAKLTQTKDMLESPPVLLAKLVLKRTNRISEQLIRESEIELDKCHSVVQVSWSFLRDFPIADLITATDINPHLVRATTACLRHFNKIKHSGYDLSRAAHVMDALSTAVNGRLLNILKEKHVMRCDIDVFRQLLADCIALFRAWDTEFTNARSALNDQAKRKHVKRLHFKTQPDHQAIEHRIRAIAEFREQHQKLIDIVTSILSDRDDSIILHLQESYKLFIRSNTDVLDVTAEGQAAWQTAVAQYEKRLEVSDESITRILEEQLRDAKSTDETFRLFSIYNPLFFRTSIRNAVNSFRVSLVRSVQEDVERLQEKFRKRYDESCERTTADLRDIPPVSGRILWAKQVENQLNMLLRRMEDVLGAGWEDHLEGKKLKEVCDELLNFINIDTLIRHWVDEVSAINRSATEKDVLETRVLLVTYNPSTSSNMLTVNFDNRLVNLFKEIRHLEYLVPDKPIQSWMRTIADEAFQRYPTATALTAALNTYRHAKSVLNKELSILVVKYEQAVRDMIQDAIMGSKVTNKRMHWNSPDLNEWVAQMCKKVGKFQEKVDDAVIKTKKIDELLSKLQACPYEHAAFAAVLGDIQAVIDEMHMRGFSNVVSWVEQLDAKIEYILVQRVEKSIDAWLRAFNAVGPVDGIGSDGDVVVVDQLVHEIHLSNQILYLAPPLEQARAELISIFHSHLDVCATLPRVVASRFNVFADTNVEVRNYASILTKLNPENLRKPYLAIENETFNARKYAQQWLQYQTLWDVSVNTVVERVGARIDTWQQLLQGIKAARATIEVGKDEMMFGPIVINFGQIQNKVNLKYDAWQKELQVKFGDLLLEEVRKVHNELVNAKRQLEGVYLEGPTRDVIIGVELILKMKASIASKKEHVADLENSEKLLIKQRHQFAKDWLPVSNVSTALSDLCQILDRRVTAMDGQLSSLQGKIREEDSAIQERVQELLSTWERDRPISGSCSPVDALQVLGMYSAQVNKLLEEANRISGAKSALGLDFLEDNRLEYVTQEITDLKDVWQAILAVWEKLQNIRSTPYKDIVIMKVRKSLDALTEDLNTLPLKMRSYAPFENMQETIAKYLSAQPALRDLCSEALKDRHWKMLGKMLNIPYHTSDLKLGQLWDVNLRGHRKNIGEILTTAQGELALEQFIREVKEFWTNAQMNVVLRENVRLITDWSVLFTALEDHLNSLASLKQSPYFRNVPEFQEDTSIWENKLTVLRGLLDLWVDVQRKWVYLCGIFKNPDIKAQLPTQFSKFKGVDSEFTRLMKRVHMKPTITDILLIEGLHGQLERQDSSMSVIQKALGEYLEKQRQVFPRFYFVNNEDLVEIIGNSNEPAKIVNHISKMFSALNTISIDANAADATKLIGSTMCSKEGELVTLCSPIDMSVGVKEWLGSLEAEMIKTLATLLQQAMNDIPSDDNALLPWINKFPAQVVMLACQIMWCSSVEEVLGSSASGLETALKTLQSRLYTLSQSVLQDVESSLRRKCEQLITEIVHQRDVTRVLIGGKVNSKTDFGWAYHLRFYWNQKEADLMKRLCIKISNASFFYGFEYLGISERLVQTPLTDRCYLTLTQALHLRMAGNPFGPAGTGKTESVKMLGSQLGRFVLVFNCDENFDYAAMGRIFAGLCQVGAWGCFDEFNRLEERILSAVSQQILTIQRGLMSQQDRIELLGNPCKLHKDVGLFVTMNPGYAGRSNLPDNLKQLFRAVAMSVPDRKMIAQVMLFSQGITTAEELAGKIVLLFTLCEEQLSAQSHYDFGLRALKSVLTGAGDLKRQALLKIESGDANMAEIEKNVLIRSTCNSVVPKLVAQDIPLFTSLLMAVYPGTDIPSVSDSVLEAAIAAVCAEDCLEADPAWVEKVLQLNQVIEQRHGVMLVGPSSGKTTAWRTLLKALARVDGAKGEFFVIDPKSIRKDKLFGSLDPNTLEWTDGVFTKILRRVMETAALRTGPPRRSWIVFDGDVDPEWAENLNSVLDDNKILTLPSGDRLKIPPGVRIMMEVDSLKHATLATVSRCGMVWFAENIVTWDMLFKKLLTTLRKENVEMLDVGTGFVGTGSVSEVQKEAQGKYVDILSTYFVRGGIVEAALEHSLRETHIMDVQVGRLLTSLYSILVRGLSLIMDYNEANSDFPMNDSQMEQFTSRWLLLALQWGFGSSMNWDKRIQLGDVIMRNSTVDLPTQKSQLLDFTVNISDGMWVEWASMVPRLEIESHKVTATDVVVPTTDTVRHVEVLRSWLSSHKPLILCGPPGSGKTMSLTSLIDAMPEYVLVALNFSSGTTPDLILKTFTQYCEVVDSPDGLVMQPNRQSYSEDKWIVVFCDEINLPQEDKYGTQRVIMFMRQLTEQGGYWNKDCKWVSLRRIQFVGACNPPTDAGRVPLSSRFMRHCSLLLVDYPSEDSLLQIYRCFNHALLKLHPNLRGSADSLTESMVDFYGRNKSKFTPDMAPQYIYSPRELSRWVRALYEAVEPMEALTMDELVRLWAHEGLRLFQDRLVTDEQRRWCDAQIDEVALKHFPAIDSDTCLSRPMLYSNWLSKAYMPVDRERLRDFVAARLKVFYEEELDVPLVIFDDVLEHVLRIDNVLRHPMGHLLLVGESGVGKTVLSKFVSWMNGLSIFQIKANNRYTIENFDEDLRGLLRRVGVEGEKVCFIFDESNALSSAFLERMNALLASGEVPGLFEGEELAHLISSCQSSAMQKEGSLSDTSDEIWRRFTKAVQRNLHVVFTMNPASTDFENRCTTSPALFNRCVVNWFGTWNQNALAQVGHDFTLQLDTGYTMYSAPPHNDDVLDMVLATLNKSSPDLHDSVVAALVSIHNIVKALTIKLGKVSGRQHYLSPRDFLDLIRKFVTTEQEKRVALEEQQTHIRTGLDKLHQTEAQVTELRAEMVQKEAVLRTKDAEANSKLSTMVEKQNEAENRKAVAEELTEKLTKQNEEIRVRRESVESELSEAEPALLSAKQSVQNIRKAQLDEVRALARPPTAVQLTLEMVIIMMGEKSTDWGEIRKVIRRDDFISTVVNFDPMNITPKQAKKVQEYINNPELDYASVDRASKACGPLYQWAESQLKYSSILRKVKPLRDEVESLIERSETLQVQQQEAVEQVKALEEAIAVYKAEYAAAIRDTQTIRSEMEVVTKKVSRAESLLNSLNQEKERWQASSNSFDIQMSTLIGDALMAAGFLTYGGIFDHRARRLLQVDWADTIEGLGIPFRRELDIIDYLSTPSDRLLWQSYGLPSDDLAMQNSIILERFYRFPMVVDPSGQATEFFMRKYAAQKIAQTSFLDTSFLKTLASAVRFGTPLLVQDVETVDPILNPVLNKEFQKAGGRTLIRIGSEDIDYSPKFMIVLVTRNPFARFAPDLCSRVTMVNFTVTPASLEAQALSAILRAERPDVDRRRNEVQKLMSEQSVKLRALEESLLNKISAVQGAILDDDTVINTLETIKSEAADLNREAQSTELVMQEVKGISAVYEPLASAMASVYFSIERLADVNSLYQFSLQFFLAIVERVLSQCAQKESELGDTSAAAAKKRLEILSAAFYNEVSRRVLRGLKFEDKLMFVVRLAQIATMGNDKKDLTDAESDFLLRGVIPIVKEDAALLARHRDAITGHTLSENAAKLLYAACSLPAFGSVLKSMQFDDSAAWSAAFASEDMETRMPMGWVDNKTLPERAALLRIILISILRPDRVMSALELYVACVFGDDYKWRQLATVTLQDIVNRDSHCAAPLILCSDVGHDASSKVDALAGALGKNLLQVAMGSAEGYSEAEKSIAQAAKSGGWVLLRNVHLCPEWLNLLEKKVHNLKPHDSFRLFLTCDINPNIPTSLLRLSDVVLYEASTGIKANLLRFTSSVPAARVDKAPAERGRLYALLAWLNAIVQERLRYAPLGWTKRYEFSEADAACAVECIDEWIDKTAGTRSHISPDEIPWAALRTSLSQSLYGGRVDNPFDQAALDSFINNIFKAENFSANAVLASDYVHGNAPLVTLPQSCSREAFDTWVSQLPDKNSPAWLGLPNTAENQLQSLQGKHVLSRLVIVQGLFEATGTDEGDAHSSLKHHLETVTMWLKQLPDCSSIAHVDASKTSDVHSSPLERCIAREVVTAMSVLQAVREDIELVRSYCAGESKLTNAVRDILGSFTKGSVPRRWRSYYSTPSDTPVASWITDLAERLRALNKVVKTGASHPVTYWLGGLFSSESFITATRQNTAQTNKWSLEELELYLDIGVDTCEGVQDTVIERLVIEGAEWSKTEGLKFSSALRQGLPPSRLRWKRRSGEVDAECMPFPVYLNESRTTLIMEVLVRPPDGIPRDVWAQRGVAFVMQSII